MDVRRALKLVAGAIGASLPFAAVVTVASLWQPPKPAPQEGRPGPSGGDLRPLPNQTYPLDRKSPGEPHKKREAWVDGRAIYRRR